MRKRKTMLLIAAALFGIFMLCLVILYAAAGARMDAVPDWVSPAMLIPAVILWALLSPWQLIDLERRREDADTNARKWRGEAMNLVVKLRSSTADAEEHRRDVETLAADNERLQTLLDQTTATAMETQERYRSVLNLIAKHFCAEGEHLPGRPDDRGVVCCGAGEEVLNADEPNESPCCGGEGCGEDSCADRCACAPAEENRE